MDSLLLESRIRNEILLKGIKKNGTKYFNPYVFCPRNETGYRDFRYYQPVNCISRRSGKKLNMIWVREGRTNPKNLMDDGRSGQLTLMWSRLRGVDCLRELVIILSDQDLRVYRDFLLQEGYCEKRLESMGPSYKYVWKSTYLSADLYFPEYKMIFELDSKYHTAKGVDRARDKMLEKQYGLKTYRFFEYDKNWAEQESMVVTALGSSRLDVPLYFNQLDLIVERWKRENPEALKSLLM